jgi:peptidoglycan-N-acetylmuramic acid deacetylase
LTLILSIICNPTCAEESKGWYIKRRGNQRPDFPTDAILLKQHNAFFIDESYPDERAEKRLYLTFDAGYENGNVEKILDILQKEKVVAAFFLLDNIILKRPDLVKRMESEGHLVCNHTKRHKDISKMSREEIREDLSELEKICADKTGVEMSRFFRFPEGKYSLYALNALNELGYKTVFWSFAYEDWDNNNQMKPSAALKKILDNTHNGAIVLLHPTSDTNATILSELINAWRNMGYSFGSLNDL